MKVEEKDKIFLPGRISGKLFAFGIRVALGILSEAKDLKESLVLNFPVD